MGKVAYMKVKGSNNFRLRLLLATLSSKPIIIEDIRTDATWPGLRPYEVSFLHLLEKVSDDCFVQINETGTKLKYKPGILLGGKNLVHDCGTSRGIGYFLEPLIVLGLFGKKPLSIRLIGITNDAKDPCFDTFRAATLPILMKFGVPSEGLGLKLEKRGVPPHGGGEIVLFVPNQDSLKSVTWIDEGMVKRIRGYSFSTRVSVQFDHSMVAGTRGIFNNFIPDVYVFIDRATGVKAAKSPGYGISLIAETTSGCFISADTAVTPPGREDEMEVDDEDTTGLTPPEQVGEQTASQLLNEIEQGGVVDSTHQGLLFLLCALCPPDVSKVRVGKLSPYGIEVLRHIKEFLGVKFIITPDPSTGTVILKCVGSGMKNLSRKLS